MRASDPRYHVALGIAMEQHNNEWSFDRSATFSDLWRILFHNLIRHPLKTTVFAHRYTHGRRHW